MTTQRKNISVPKLGLVSFFSLHGSLHFITNFYDSYIGAEPIHSQSFCEFCKASQASPCFLIYYCMIELVLVELAFWRRNSRIFGVTFCSIWFLPSEEVCKSQHPLESLVFVSWPRDPIRMSWNLNTMRRRWLDTLIIIWEYDWNPRAEFFFCYRSGILPKTR